MPFSFIRSRRALVGSFLGLLQLGSILCRGAEEVEPQRFEKTVVVSSLIQPMEMAIAPDGKIFLIELNGLLKLIDPKSGQIDTVGKLEVTTAQENGLIGLALDPDFATNHWIYLQYSPPDFPGQRISRFEFKDRLDLASEKVLLSYEEQRRECCHHAGSMEFGPDGCLYIGAGDNTNPFDDSQGFAPIDERPGREPWDAQRTSGNTKSFNGKILRIRPMPDGTYSIPDGNLFPKDGSVGHPEIFVMGCRNPWRLNVDKRTGYLYWGDVGPDAGQDGPRGPRGYDEVNQAKTAGNYGWPYFIGPTRPYSMVDFVTGKINPPQDPAHPMNRSVNNTGAKELPPARSPIVYYPAGPIDEFPEVGSGGRTACAGPVYYYDVENRANNRFPAAYDRTLFAFEWSRNWILAVHLDADSNVQKLERFLPDMPFIRPIDLQFDSQGSLYVIEYGETWGVNADARLVRVDYIRGNRAPVAKATSENNVGREPLRVTFSAKGSSDKDRDSLSYRWRMIKVQNENRTEQILGDKESIEAEIAEPGSYTVELEVTDAHGAKGTTSLPVVVGNTRPKVDFQFPRNGSFFTPGKAIDFRIRVRDFEDGASDADEANDANLDSLDENAPGRAYVQGRSYALGESPNQVASDPPGLALIRKSDCLNCHNIDKPLVGPMFVDIANKYRGKEGALDQSIERVIKGSTGVWGKVAMLPHSQHTADQVREMVQYVFSVQADERAAMFRGFTNSFPTDDKSETVRLEATYTDAGRNELPALTASSAILLRSRLVQAESADEFAGTSKLSSHLAAGNSFMGAIEHNGFLRFRGIAFDQVKSIVVHVASAGAGGQIEIHRGSVNGPLLGSTPVEVNGEWEKFYKKTIELKESDSNSSQIEDLFVVFKNEANRGGLMNLDQLEFLP